MGKVLYVVLIVGVAGLAYTLQGLCKPKVAIPPPDNQWWGPGTPEEENTLIRPFKINISDKIIQDLNQRLDNTRLAVPPLEGIHFQYGFNTDTLKKIITFWRKDYKWRDRETFLNKLPQFKTKIQGLDVHFIHVKPKITDPAVKRTIPLLLLHGWPGSVREFYSLIPLLTTKPQHGADFVFEVIVPSLPGYGFSQAAAKTGLGTAQIAVLFNNLMKRLGHDKYYVQGGDWGSQIASNMGVFYPDNVLGLHLNMCTVNNLCNSLKIALGSLFPRLIVDEKDISKLYPLGEKFGDLLLETGYFHLQATKPDTLGVGVTDSPAGLAAYILEKFSTATDVRNRETKDGGLTDKFTMTDLLDNVMIYWVTGSITSSFRLYAETTSRQHRAIGLDTAQHGKKGGGFNVLWIPGKRHNKHKNHGHGKHHGRSNNSSIGSQRGPVAEAAGTATLHRAMMSGDTPECHARDPFHELKDKSPACSSGLPKPAGELVTASVLVEPQPKQDGPVQCPPVDGPEPRRARSTSTDDDVIETAETPLAIRKCPNGKERIAQDDAPDSTDSAMFVGNNINGKKKKNVNDSEEEDGCVVKCLYYTLQCCECTIM
ncbi:Juvenile hormone epoxide hydrolase 2 [Carabus blaptoides fortunei]